MTGAALALARRKINDKIAIRIFNFITAPGYLSSLLSTDSARSTGSGQASSPQAGSANGSQTVNLNSS
jgi:hypothetical protein